MGRNGLCGRARGGKAAGGWGDWGDWQRQRGSARDLFGFFGAAFSDGKDTCGVSWYTWTGWLFLQNYSVMRRVFFCVKYLHRPRGLPRHNRHVRGAIGRRAEGLPLQYRSGGVHVAKLSQFRIMLKLQPQMQPPVL